MSLIHVQSKKMWSKTTGAAIVIILISEQPDVIKVKWSSCGSDAHFSGKDAARHGQSNISVFF